MENVFQSLQNIPFVVPVECLPKAVYFKLDSTISGAFQSSACSVEAPPTRTFSTINFLRVEGPFLDEVGPFSVVWRNYRLAGRVGAFSQLVKDIINPYNCLLKNVDFLIKTSNE